MGRRWVVWLGIVVVAATGAACGARATEEPLADPRPAGGDICNRDRDALMNPDACLVGAGTWGDAGIIHSYRQLDVLSVRNKSKVPMGHVEGEVTWLNGDGSVAGTVPFTTVGTVPAGGTTQFSAAAGTLTNEKLQSKAPSFRLRFTSARGE